MHHNHQSGPPQVSWRDVINVHPVAEAFPIMTADELRALGEDIAKKGLTSPLAITASRKIGGDWKYQLLDGRNRLDAMELAGIQFKLVLEDGKCKIKSELDYCRDGGFYPEAIVVEEADAYAYVVSINIRRRHLTAEQKRDLIAHVLRAQPTKSNRQVAKLVGVSHPHAAAVRAELEKCGDVEAVSTSIDTKGRAQRAHKPVAKKRRDIDDDLLDKKVELVADAAESHLVRQQPVITNTAARVDAVEPTDSIITATDAPTHKEQAFALSTELLAFDGPYSKRVRDWCKSNPDNPCRTMLAGIIEAASLRMQALAREIRGFDDEAPRIAQSETRH